MDKLRKLFEEYMSRFPYTKDLGKKKLAYPINKEVSGNYYVMTVTASTDVIKEFDRKVRINENVIRHLILNLDEE